MTFPLPAAVSQLSPLAVLADRAPETVSPRDNQFGGFGSGTQSDVTAINRAFDYCRSVYDNTNKCYPVSIDFRGYKWLIDGPLNSTLFTEVATNAGNPNGVAGLNVYGGTFIGTCTGQYMFDCTGSWNINWWGCLFRGVQASAPKASHLLARMNAPSVLGATSHKFFGCHWNGAFSEGNVNNNASEITSFKDCRFANYYTGGTCYNVIIDGYGSFGQASPFVTIAPVQTLRSMTQVGFDHCEFVMGNGSFPATGYNIYLANCSGIRFDQCYAWNNSTNSFVYIDFPLATDTMAMRDIMLDIHAESPTATSWLLFNNGANSHTVQDITIKDKNPFATAMVASGSGGITWNKGLVMHSNPSGSLPVSAFDDESKYLVRSYRHISPKTSQLPTATSFRWGSSGWTEAMDRNPSEVAFTRNFPYNGAALDLDFVNQRYYWGGVTKATGDFSSFTLGAGSLGALGLTPATDTVITIDASQIGSAALGTLFAVIYQTGVPGATTTAVQFDDGSDNNRINLGQLTTNQPQFVVVTGAAAQANVGCGTVASSATLNMDTAIGGSYDTNNFIASGNGVAGTAPDSSGSVPAVTIFRVGKRVAAGTQLVGSLLRCIFIASTQTQAALNATTLVLMGV